MVSSINCFYICIFFHLSLSCTSPPSTLMSSATYSIHVFSALTSDMLSAIHQYPSSRPILSYTPFISSDCQLLTRCPVLQYDSINVPHHLPFCSHQSMHEFDILRSSVISIYYCISCMIVIVCYSIQYSTV